MLIHASVTTHRLDTLCGVNRLYGLYLSLTRDSFNPFSEHLVQKCVE
ncbi:hypothetical protein [Microbulbifer elongatus]|nr:hypothetical protein [Microbulbifer elongatus]